MTTAIKLRPGRFADALAIVQVHHAAIRKLARTHYGEAIIDAWAPEPIFPDTVGQLAERMQRGEELVVVATAEDDRIVGFGSIVPEAGELRAVYVAPNYDRRGIGTSILRQLEALARDAHVQELHLDASLNAQAFYVAEGYAVVKPGAHVLANGQSMDCLMMRKRLVP